MEFIPMGPKHIIIILFILDTDKLVTGLYNFFSCSTHLSTKFQLLINTKILTNKEIKKSLRCCIYHANKC